jgi:hypothetical protein
MQGRFGTSEHQLHQHQLFIVACLRLYSPLEFHDLISTSSLERVQQFATLHQMRGTAASLPLQLD